MQEEGDSKKRGDAKWVKQQSVTYAFPQTDHTHLCYDIVFHTALDALLDIIRRGTGRSATIAAQRQRPTQPTLIRHICSTTRQQWQQQHA